MANRVLITGGAGFIGSHVAQRFLDAGWSVEILDDLSTGRRANVPAAARLQVADVRSPEAARIVAGGYHVVAHFAAQIDVRRSVEDPAFDASVNVLGTVNLAEAIRRESPERRPRIVFASTGGALYGDSTTPPSAETVLKEPESPYAISKLSAEAYLAAYGRLHGLETVALRFGNVYGPRQDPHGEAGVVAIFCGRILGGRSLTVYGDGEQTRDYVYVKDVADVTLRAASALLPPAGRLDSRAFNIATGVETSVNALARMLAQAAGTRAAIEYAPPRKGELARSALDIGKAAAHLGWRPAVSLEAGLRETFGWFAAQQAATPMPA